MENTNKPQWLIDAEKDIQEFEDSKYGKMDNKEFLYSQRQSNAASVSGKNNVKNGIFGTKDSKANKALKESGWYESERNKKICSENGKKIGPIQGRKNVESGHWKNIVTFESRSKGGKKAIQKMINHEKRTEWLSYAGKQSANKKLEKRDIIRKKIVEQLPIDTEFTSKIVRELCDKENYRDWKGLLLDDRFIIKVHHGPNQHNPSRYKRI
jgi:hypothetical protein